MYHPRYPGPYSYSTSYFLAKVSINSMFAAKIEKKTAAVYCWRARALRGSREGWARGFTRRLRKESPNSAAPKPARKKKCNYFRMTPRCRLLSRTLTSHRKNAHWDHCYELTRCLAARPHLDPKGAAERPHIHASGHFFGTCTFPVHQQREATFGPSSCSLDARVALRRVDADANAHAGIRPPWLEPTPPTPVLPGTPTSEPRRLGQ